MVISVGFCRPSVLIQDFFSRALTYPPNSVIDNMQMIRRPCMWPHGIERDSSDHPETSATFVPYEDAPAAECLRRLGTLSGSPAAGWDKVCAGQA